MMGLSPNVLLMCDSSATNLPDRSPASKFISTLPTRSRRALRSFRSFSSRRTRPSLRTPRALMPWRIHTSS